jgi:flagellar basal-body rod protein FlgF
MAGGHFIALSGMRSRLDDLDRLAADIANAATAGYKSERTTDAQANRPQFDSVLQTAIDVAPGGRRLNVAAGPMNTTGRDLDFAIEGSGFFVVETPGGTRYTRNGAFTVSETGALVTADGASVVGDSGPISLGPGKVTVERDGTLRAGGVVAGKLSTIPGSCGASLVCSSAATASHPPRSRRRRSREARSRNRTCRSWSGSPS